MNNIYVSELPKRCDSCVGYGGASGRCKLLHKPAFIIPPKDCPLKLLSTRLAEERKKVVQEIRDLAGDYFEMPYCDACGNTDFNDVVLTGKDLTEILDDVERGE